MNASYRCSLAFLGGQAQAAGPVSTSVREESIQISNYLLLYMTYVLYIRLYVKYIILIYNLYYMYNYILCIIYFIYIMYNIIIY